MPARLRLLLVLLLCAVAPARLPAAEVPYLAGRVNDNAGMLSPEAKQRLEEKLRGLEERTGAEVVVLTVPSLEGEPLEDYSVRVAQTWKLGQGDKDNGALLLVSKGDRKLRLESGYGLEAELTDLRSKEIIDDVITPRFRNGDFEGGIEAGTDAIAAVIEGKPLAVAERPPGDTAADLPVVPRLGFGLIFLIVMGIFSFAALSSSGCQSWFLYAFLTPFYFAIPSALFGPAAGVGVAVGWLIAFPLLRALLGRGGPRGPRSGGGRGGWARSRPVFVPWVLGGGGGGWSSRGGGWSGAGGGGFGGFSGGGGSFGGGGASGSW